MATPGDSPRLVLGSGDRWHGRANAACPARSPRCTGSLPSRPVTRMISTSSGCGATKCREDPACPACLLIGASAPRPRASQQLRQARSSMTAPAAGFDGIPHVTAGLVRGRASSLRSQSTARQITTNWASCWRRHTRHCKKGAVHGSKTSARTLPHLRRQPGRPRHDVPVADGQSEWPTLGVTARMPVLAGSAIGALTDPLPTRRAVPDTRTTRHRDRMFVMIGGPSGRRGSRRGTERSFCPGSFGRAGRSGGCGSGGPLVQVS